MLLRTMDKLIDAFDLDVAAAAKDTRVCGAKVQRMSWIMGPPQSVGCGLMGLPAVCWKLCQEDEYSKLVGKTNQTCARIIATDYIKASRVDRDTGL